MVWHPIVILNERSIVNESLRLVGKEATDADDKAGEMLRPAGLSMTRGECSLSF